MKAVPKGRLITTKEIQARIAQKYNVTMGCPICCGIFAWIAANEEEFRGFKQITPYWRTRKSGRELNPKFSGGVEELKVCLEAKENRVVSKGKRWIVADYESRLVSVGSADRTQQTSRASSNGKLAKSAVRGR